MLASTTLMVNFSIYCIPRTAETTLMSLDLQTIMVSNMLSVTAPQVSTAQENHLAFIHGINMRECPRVQVFANVYFYSTRRIYLHIMSLREAARSLQPLKRLVISARCVWPRVCELHAVWASCSLCLLFTAEEA